MSWDFANFRRRVRLVILVAGTPFLFLLGYGFLSGMVGAALGNRWIPPHLRRVAELYCEPAINLTYVPFIGILVKAGNYSGYSFVGGPETTR